MNVDFKKMEEYIKAQAEVFLLEMKSFYPFGCAIDRTKDLKPLGVYLEEEKPSVLDLINLIENNIKKKLETGDYIMAVVAIDVMVKENDVNYDGIELRFFEKNAIMQKKNIRYVINGNHVEFPSGLNL